MPNSNLITFFFYFYFKHLDSNDQPSSRLPLNQRNFPASFWNCNYFIQQAKQQQSHNYQSNLVTDHSHHYLPLIEPSASTSSLQPLLQLETLSQLTHLQNHTQSSSLNSTATNSMANFTASATSQHSTQNSSSLINNPINSLTFAHHLQHHHHSQTAADNFNALDHHHQQLTQSNAQLTNSVNLQPSLSQPTTDLTAQPQFLHHLLQQNNHNPFQYAQNAVIQSDPASFQQHSSLTAHYGPETSNNWSPHFIPLASPASSSSCSSNAENNVNRPNKLTGASLGKQYDQLTKPTARFALASSALLQLNSAGTSPNRSPLSTTTSSPALHGGGGGGGSGAQAGPVNSLALNESTTNYLASSNNASSSPISTTSSSNSIISSTTSTASTTSSTLAKSFTHFAHQSADHWTHHATNHHSVAHQPYLAFHQATHNLTSYHTPTSNTSVDLTKADKSDSSSAGSVNYNNQYNSLLLTGTATGSSSINGTSGTNSVCTQSTKAANSLPHTLTHPTMSNHLTNYNYYHLNPLNQINPLTSSASDASTAAINFHHHHYHHNASNYNGYNNYNYGLAAMTGK